jgi:hypothetical protein
MTVFLSARIVMPHDLTIKDHVLPLSTVQTQEAEDFLRHMNQFKHHLVKYEKQLTGEPKQMNAATA